MNTKLKGVLQLLVVFLVITMHKKFLYLLYKSKLTIGYKS